MGPANSTCSKPRETSNPQGESPGWVSGFMASKEGRPKNQKGRKDAIVGSFRNGLIFLQAILLIAGIWIVPAIALDTTDCCICHGTLEEVHGDWDHTAVPGSGPVVLFADTDHDESGRVGDKPYFDAMVGCRTCHVRNLPAIHGNDCDTCHPTPYDTLGIWGRGCQQGGCHSFYHQDSTKAHLPFEDPFDYEGNDCFRCHETASWDVTDTKCLNCHDEAMSGDLTPPFTTSNAQAVYIGPAKIDFSIMDNGKVGLGRTFFRLDAGPDTAAGKSLSVKALGSHDLEFWSKDQYGNTEETIHSASFTIEEDTTPPTTTSDAQASYYQGALITLVATDNGTQGVKTTFYRLNNGPIQSGTSVLISAPNGGIPYTLVFWSEDWSGNVEAENSVDFTVTSGSGAIQLVWWDCDVYPSQAPANGDSANWTIRLGGLNGVLIASGSGGGPGWSGINNISVPVSPTPYYIKVDWDSPYDGGGSIFPNIYVTTPVQVVRLSY